MQDSGSEPRTPPSRPHPPFVVIVRNDEPSPAAVVDATVRAQLLLVEATLEQVALCCTRIRPVAVIVPELVFAGHETFFEDCCVAVGAELIVLPAAPFDEAQLIDELRRAGERDRD